MTIKEKIKTALQEIQNRDEQLYKICYDLHNQINQIITEVRDHLSKIQQQMPDYDKHNEEHSNKVIQNIESLLQDEGIQNLTLLEAMLVELCGYFHDVGMALPDWCFKLLEEVEKPDYAYHNNDAPMNAIIGELKEKFQGRPQYTYSYVKDLFFCPESESKLLSFLAKEVLDYESYRKGLATPSQEVDRETYTLQTRQDYLRSTHGDRAEQYAQHIGKKLKVLNLYDADMIAKSVGRICRGHCVEIKEVQDMQIQIGICEGKTSDNALTYNERYIAMLLRLGDVIHFSSDRASRTLYAEHVPMNAVSDAHWRVKLDNLHYKIEQRESNTKITYYAGFEDPKLYYFVQDYLNWVDDELHYYAAFVQDMNQLQKATAARYRNGIPTSVGRDGIKPLGYAPDMKLKFCLEQKKIIQLLMGMRLYSNEFMCLRELYQNALDACRCMRAKNHEDGLHGELKIEFGLDTDEGGTYLFCRDEGVGMTKQIIMDYLLRVGNSYYHSVDFRRNNHNWGNEVAPVSEFGIGLLSCYMIGSRIEVITRHYSPNAQTYWVCMESAEDYGYFREVPEEVAERVGKHGTIIKVYLKDTFKNALNSYVPEDLEDTIYLLHHDVYEPDKPENSFSIKNKHKYERFKKSLYWRVHEFVRIPEKDIPVFIWDEQTKPVRLVATNKYYGLPSKIQKLIERNPHIYYISQDLEIGFIGSNSFDSAGVRWIQQLSTYQCSTIDEKTKSEVYTIISLPNSERFLDRMLYKLHFLLVDQSIDGNTSMHNGFFVLVGYIDGIHVGDIIECDFPVASLLYNFKGVARPLLTVNRESIREVPREALIVAQTLQHNLTQEIVKIIDLHFKNAPYLKTDSILYYVKKYLHFKYASIQYLEIMKQLSAGIFSEYAEGGVRLRDLLSSTDMVIPTTFFDCIPDDNLALLSFAMCRAEIIDVDENGVTLRKRNNSLPKINEKIFDVNIPICATTWSGAFLQYDIVSSVQPLVPKSVFTLLVEKDKAYESLWFYFQQVLNSVHQYFHDYMRSYRLFETNGSKEIWSQNRSKYFCSLLGREIILDGRYDFSECFIEDPQKKYVVYALLDHNNIFGTEDEDADIFDSVPEYVRGKKEGWSVLFYRYNDGCIIAPGIVDREEMLKKLPDEVKNHDDGIEYFFTDGTKAF